LLTENDKHRENRKNLPITQNVVGDQPLPAQKKSRRGLYSQTRNNRWKWMAGATAATAAGVTTSQAGFVTINLTGNFISATGGNHLNADLTGDGQPDVVIANAFNSVSTNPSLGFPYVHYIARVNLNAVPARAHLGRYDGSGYLTLGSQYKHFSGANSGVVSGSLTGSIPVVFKDLHINGGALTKGSLEVTVVGKVVLGDPNERPSVAKVQLDSLTYNTPDQGSSLALLAMGAAGVLALRRWRATQEQL
jgi:hypothetical protein